jgi:hypothetical protein
MLLPVLIRNLKTEDEKPLKDFLKQISQDVSDISQFFYGPGGNCQVVAFPTNSPKASCKIVGVITLNPPAIMLTEEAQDMGLKPVLVAHAKRHAKISTAIR